MNTLLVVGLMLTSGIVLGELGEKLGFPRVTGYILAGILLNPEISHIVPISFVQTSESITNVSLAILTFSVGGTLAIGPLKELGKGIAFIALGEAELAALIVTSGLLIALPFLAHIQGATFIGTYLPLALLLGALASPTDPSATLAVMHQYKAKGPVSFTVMGAAALDDALGIMNFSIATALAAIFSTHTALHVGSLLVPVGLIGASIGLGIVGGLLFHFATRTLHNVPEGIYIVTIIAVLALCYGLATLLGLDQLLATMTVGITVVNFGRQRDRIFRLIEEYMEPLVFVLFFTISGMYLDFSVLLKFFPFVLLFVVLRAIGKLSGTFAGASLAHTTHTVRRYTGWGLLPQGGIVIGLALIMRQNPAFSDISNIIVSVTIGATVIHELIGPVTSKLALQKAGELRDLGHRTDGQ
ncbi:MAG TPA: sodium:proton exchanger [Candidatus Acetothermia bacterium]|nr:sodium:proton exchanger [Candidatus Acetothermia bacterium]